MAGCSPNEGEVNQASYKLMPPIISTISVTHALLLQVHQRKEHKRMLVTEKRAELIKMEFPPMDLIKLKVGMYQ